MILQGKGRIAYIQLGGVRLSDIDPGAIKTLWWRGGLPHPSWQARAQSWGVEFKYEDAPRLTRSMKTAVEDLKLERLWVIYPGKADYRLTEKIEVIPLADVRDTWNYG